MKKFALVLGVACTGVFVFFLYRYATGTVISSQLVHLGVMLVTFALGAAGLGAFFKGNK